MSARRSRWFVHAAACAASVSFAAGAAHAEACAPRDPGPVAATLRAMFAGVVGADERAFAALFTPDAYLFDGGKRFSPLEIRALIAKAVAGGRRYTWTVPSPDVHLGCRTARIAYVNRGAVAEKGIVTPRTWLESADLEWSGTAWKIAFFHSTPVTPVAPHPN